MVSSKINSYSTVTALISQLYDLGEERNSPRSKGSKEGKPCTMWLRTPQRSNTHHPCTITARSCRLPLLRTSSSQPFSPVVRSSVRALNWSSSILAPLLLFFPHGSQDDHFIMKILTWLQCFASGPCTPLPPISLSL